MNFSDDLALFRSKYADLAREIYRQGFADMPDSERSFDNLSQGINLEVLFIYDGIRARLFGFLFFQTVEDQGEILTIVIEKRCQNQGIGRALLKVFLARIQSRAKTVFLEVAVDNARAISLYQSLGFVEIGIRKNYYKRQKGLRVDAKVFAFSATVIARYVTRDFA